MQIEIGETQLIAIILILISTLIWVFYLYLEKKHQNKMLSKIIQNYQEDSDYKNQQSRNFYGNFEGEGHKQNKIDIKSNENNKKHSESIANFKGKNHTGNEVKTEINKRNEQKINNGILLDNSQKTSHITDSTIKEMTMNMN